MSATTTFYDNLGNMVFEASGDNRHDLFKRVKNEHSSELHAIFEEFNIEESGEAEKDVRAWWAEAHPDGYIDTIEEDAPPPSTIFVVRSPLDDWTVHVFGDLTKAVEKFHTTGFQSKAFTWNGKEWESR